MVHIANICREVYKSFWEEACEADPEIKNSPKDYYTILCQYVGKKYNGRLFVGVGSGYFIEFDNEKDYVWFQLAHGC